MLNRKAVVTLSREIASNFSYLKLFGRKVPQKVRSCVERDLIVKLDTLCVLFMDDKEYNAFNEKMDFRVGRQRR